MTINIARRKFIATLSGAAVAWPLAARAQQAAIPVIGFINGASPASHRFAAFRQGVKEAGFVEGQNVMIEDHWAEGHYDRLPVIVDELIDRHVAVIATTGGLDPARAAKNATTKIPIVFVIGGDPIKFGLVDSLNRPGGNLTGVSLLAYLVEVKRLELVHELLPKAAVVAVLANPTNSETASGLIDLQAAARTIGQRLIILNASTEGDVDTAFATLQPQRPDALIVSPDPFFLSRYERIVALATRLAVPAVYAWRDFVDAGGLMSYGTSLADAYRQAGVYAGRILKGEKPADLAVQQSVKVELVINMNTAKALGLTVPLALLGRADEVIE
jgi:putative tryptophan/tyrosine transport system substrate-binding protein